jgi:hypothetical protein
VVFEHRKLARVLELVVSAVLLVEEQVDLGGGELVGVAGVDANQDGVAGSDEAALVR